MIKAVLKIVFGLAVAAGIILILGVAGNDCDGKCMENAMPLGQMIEYTFYGIALVAFGAWGLNKIPE